MKSKKKTNETIHSSLTKGIDRKANGKKTIEKQTKAIEDFCKSILEHANDYEAKTTFDNLRNKFIKTGKRIFYSEISKYIYKLSEEEMGTFITNLEALVEYTFNQNDCEKEQKIVLKIWDHVQLAQSQKKNFESDSEIIEGVFKNHELDLKRDWQEKLDENNNNMIVQNVTILGIFAAIVLAFTGGMVFSTSVMKYINQASVYRLVIVASMIGIFFTNMLLILVELIKGFKENDQERKWIWFFFNGLFLFLIIATAVASHFKWLNG